MCGVLIRSCVLCLQSTRLILDLNEQNERLKEQMEELWQQHEVGPCTAKHTANTTTDQTAQRNNTETFSNDYSQLEQKQKITNAGTDSVTCTDSKLL